MSKDPHRQVRLRSGQTETVAWLPESPALRVGNSVTLKDSEDPQRWWNIVSVGQTTTDKSKLNRTWNNNI